MLAFFFLCFFITAQFWLTPFNEAMVLTTASGAKRPAAYRLLAPLVRGTLSVFWVILTISTAGPLAFARSIVLFRIFAMPAFYDRRRVESVLCANLKPVILI